MGTKIKFEMTQGKQSTRGEASPIISGNNNSVSNQKTYKDGFIHGILIGVISGVITGVILYYLFGGQPA